MVLGLPKAKIMNAIQVVKIIIATKKGSLELNLIQLEGKSPTNIQDFINGQPQFVESVLSS